MPFPGRVSVHVGGARQGAVAVPDAPACDDSLEVRVFHSPERPNAPQPLRVFATSTRQLGPVELAAPAVLRRPAQLRFATPPISTAQPLESSRQRSRHPRLVTPAVSCRDGPSFGSSYALARNRCGPAALRDRSRDRADNPG